LLLSQPFVSGHIGSQHGPNKHNMLQHKLLTGAAVLAGFILVATYLAAIETQPLQTTGSATENLSHLY